MSGLDLLCGYGSDEEANTNEVIVNDNCAAASSTSIDVMNKMSVIKGLPSAMELLGTAPGSKRQISQLLPGVNVPNKVRKTSGDRFIPPQVKLERPNVVTEDTKYR
jgi:hypothetical protein